MNTHEKYVRWPVILTVLFLFSLVIIMTVQATPTLCKPNQQPSEAYCPLHNSGHDFSEWLTVQNLTCTDFKLETRGCNCGFGEIRRTDELGHQMSEFVLVQDATCTETGHQQSSCERCHRIETIIIEAKGHQWSEWTVTQEQSCELPEIQTSTCLTCNVTEHKQTKEAAGHAYNEWVVTQIMTCTQDEVAIRTCTVCSTQDQSYKSAPGHKYGEFSVTKEPTCNNAGVKQRICKTCGYVHKQEIAKLSHSYKDGYCTKCHTEHPDHWPKTYQDSGVKITIYKITGYGGGNTTCYVADVQLTDYSRFFTACGKNKYGGQSGTQAAAKLQNAVLAINGCYSAPYLDYTVVRRGVIYNGANRNLCLPAVYSSKTGLFSNVWEGQRNDLIGKKVQDLVDAGLVTDTFCFGPPILVDGVVTGGTGGGRAQRTFIGTDGKPGHLLLCVSNGRYSDGVSAGLTYKEMGQLMKDYGCNFGIPLDGGGSSTMVFKGQVLNQLANGQERTWIVDFCCVGY